MVPSGVLGDCGLIAIETSAAGFTVNAAEALIVPEVMPIIVEPVARVLANPFVPDELLIVATLPALDVQCPDCVRSWLVPSV